MDTLVGLRMNRAPGGPGTHLPHVLAALGHPEQHVRGALVVGTNGKGSTAAFGVSALGSTGVRVGSMPSPHIQELTERVRVNGRPISRPDFAAAFEEVGQAVERVGLPLNAAGWYTAIAAVHFRRRGVGLVVAEASIGGRATAPRLLGLEIKVVTGIGLDHTDVLGNSLSDITRSKVGAAQDGDHVILGRLPAEAARTGQEVLARLSGVTVWRMDQEIHWFTGVAHDGTPTVDVVTPRAAHRGLPCPLRGDHQRHNLALAVAAADAAAERGLCGELDDRLRAAVAATTWPGRLELVDPAALPGWTGQVLLDGATNPQGVATVTPELLRLAGTGRAAVVFGAMRGKNIADMTAPLPARWPLVLTRTAMAAAADPDDVRNQLSPERQALATTTPDTATALHRAAELAGPGGLVIVLGSHRLVGEARTVLRLPAA